MSTCQGNFADRHDCNPLESHFEILCLGNNFQSDGVRVRFWYVPIGDMSERNITREFTRLAACATRPLRAKVREQGTASIGSWRDRCGVFIYTSYTFCMDDIRASAGMDKSQSEVLEWVRDTLLNNQHVWTWRAGKIVK